MLRACRRVLRDGGKMVFAVIALAPGLVADAKARAIAGTPPYTDAPASYDVLLADAGFEILSHQDVTGGFADIVQRDLAAYEARAEEVIDAMGESEYAGRIALRQRRLSVLAEGLVRREIWLARPRSPGR